MQNTADQVLAQIFRGIVRWRKWVIIACMLPILAGVSMLPGVVKDIRSDAFLADDNPALIYKNRVKELFGLSDPLVILVSGAGPGSIYRAPALGVLEVLSERAASLENIDPYRVRSLATEENISSSEFGLEIQPFYQSLPQTEADSAAIEAAVAQFPLVQGSLVAHDGSSGIVLLEMEDELQAEVSYRAVAELVADTQLPPGVSVHVAGEGAVIGYLGSYVDADAQQLIPLALLIILAVVVLAFASALPALLTIVIIAASLAITLGVMVANGVPFYVVTNALPVILIGISVADAIHVFSEYRGLRPQRDDAATAAVDAMRAMWRPITLTSLTTAAGFAGLYLTAYMPPFKHFGFYAALGVMVAWFYSMTFLPAAIVATSQFTWPGLKLRAKVSNSVGSTLLTRRLQRVATGITRYPLIIVVCGVVILGLAGISAVQLQVDEDPISVFAETEPLVKADQVINSQFNGSNSLDIVIETRGPEGLFDPGVLRRMEALQNHALTLPHVGGAVSIVDYLKQMNRVLKGNTEEAYSLPESATEVAQYFLLYSATSDPADFEEEVDYDYQTANIRISVTSGSYQSVKVIVESLQAYIDAQFADDQVKATLSGRVNLHYRWISELAVSHFQGMAAALILVLAISSLLFRSLWAGLFTLIPVAGSVLVVYAAMVQLGITLGMGTSMFAAVAIGLGIDFAIHTLERLRVVLAGNDGDFSRSFEEFLASSGRALLFCFLATACGFGILMISKISSLNYFGSMVALAVLASYVLSMTFLPALLLMIKPRFLFSEGSQSRSGTGRGTAHALTIAASLLSLLTLSATSEPASAQELSADSVVAQLNSADDGSSVSRTLTMTLTDRRGKQRVRETVNYRKDYADERKLVLHYAAPSNVAGTGFLIRDYHDSSRADDQWLYLPAQRKVRRISSANRGDYFLGTDFTYEDMKLDGKLAPEDYDFELLGEVSIDGQSAYHLMARPKSEELVRELGYASMQVWISPSMWVIIRAEFTDIRGRALKTLEATDIRLVDDIWTRHKLVVKNHRTGHETEFSFAEVDYRTPIPDDTFSKRALARGR